MIWKSVVGKLWMTIIGLVALVLVILSIWLGNFIDTDFPNSKDQLNNVQSLMERLKQSASYDLTNPNDLRLINDLLIAEDAKLIVADDTGKEAIPARKNSAPSPQTYAIADFKVNNIFDQDELKRAQTGETVTKEFMSSMSEHSYIAVAMPLYDKETNRNLVFVVYQQFRTMGFTNAYITKLFIYVAVIGILLTTIFAFFLSTKITQPLFQMKKAADLIRMGQYRTRLAVRSSDEIGELASTLNHMAGELEETIKDLNDQREHLASVLRSMTDAVVSVNVIGQVFLANPQGEKLLEHWRKLTGTGFSLEDEGENNDPTAQLPLPIRELFDQVILDSILNGTREITRKINVGSDTWSVVLAPLYSRRQIHGAVAVLRDISEESRLEKLRKDFVANVSHELRTPLSMLQGYSEALLDDIVGSEEERNAIVQVIHDESLRMSRLVRDLLDLAKMEANRFEMVRATIQMNQLLTRVQRKFAGISKEREVALEPHLPEMPLEIHDADEDRLEQVFTNLLDNAIRHTPSGESIQIRMAKLEINGSWHAQIEIQDHGEGIPKEDLPYVFERFYKADKARTRSNANSGGTGLGLSIVKNIVHAHHGTIVAESELGKGTTFRIVLPCQAGVEEGSHFMTS